MSLDRDIPELGIPIEDLRNPTDLQVAITAGVEVLNARGTSDPNPIEPGTPVLDYAYPSDNVSFQVTPDHLIAKLNQTHPALNDAGRVAALVRGEVIITDLSEKRPSLPDDRFAVVKQVAGLDREQRAALLDDVAKARVAGRFGSWGALTAAWEAAEARKDSRTILMCAAAFTLFDTMRRDLKPVAPAEQAKAAPQKPQQPVRSAPKQAAPAPPKQEPQQLPKVQATMLKKLQALDAASRVRLAKAPLPRLWRPEMTKYPVRQEDVVNLWKMFTRESIERFNANGADSPADNDDQMRFAAAYQALDGRQARSSAELLELLKHTLNGPAQKAPAAPQAQKGASPPSAPPAPPKTQQPSPQLARKEPVFPNQSPPKLSLSDKAIDQILTRLKPEQVKELVGPASLVYGSSDPAAALAKAAETLRTTARDDPAREQAVNAVYAAALAVSIPDPRITKLIGPDIFNTKSDDRELDNARVSPHGPKKSLLDSLVQGYETRASDIPVTPSLTLDRVKRAYAQASLSAVLAQTKQAAAVNADAGDAPRLKKEAWVLAHAVLEAQSRLPTDWNDLADDLLS